MSNVPSFKRVIRHPLPSGSLQLSSKLQQRQCDDNDLIISLSYATALQSSLHLHQLLSYTHMPFFWKAIFVLLDMVMGFFVYTILHTRGIRPDIGAYLSILIACSYTLFRARIESLFHCER